MRRDGNDCGPSHENLTEQEIQQLRTVAPYVPDLVEIAKSRRALAVATQAIYGFGRAVKSFCMSFIVLASLAIAFRQSVFDLLNFVKGLFK